jgi:hypothetical protein
VHDRQCPRKIGDEDERRLQRCDENRFQIVVVGGDVRAQLLDARLNFLGGEIDLPDTRIR